MTVSSVISPPARDAADWLKRQLPVQARLSCDSRRIAAGDVFIAYPGENGDGRDHLEQALDAGAAAIVLEKAGAEHFEAVLKRAAAPWLPVEGLRRRAGEVAAAYLDEPTRNLTVVAVTGTNGKTSCTHWIAQGYDNRAGADADTSDTAKAAVIGTLGAGVPGQLGLEPDGQPTLTTPDAIGLQQQFAAFVGQGMELVAVEASSIGLQQGRLNGTRISVAVLTNLTRDHLDYHVTMQAYAAAKARLFAWPTLVAMVVNLEDPASAEMLNAADPDLRRIGYLVNDKTAAGGDPVGGSADAAGDASGGAGMTSLEAAGPEAADRESADLESLLAEAGERSESCSDLLTATPIDARGRIVLTHFRAASDIGAGEESAGSAESIDLQLSLIGRFNQSNALAVAGVWLSLGWSLADIAAQLERLRPVPGRLQMVGDPSDEALPLAVVDYAHTPDAIVNALGALRPLTASRGGRLWCVFGAGGNRDAGKRAPMASAAQEHADVLVLTSDNPRNEAPESILSQLRAGLSRAPHLIEVDRARAIQAALREADPADVVLIAGKGHELYQEIGGRRHPFSDVEQADLALQARLVHGQAAAGKEAAPGSVSDDLPGESDV